MNFQDVMQKGKVDAIKAMNMAARKLAVENLDPVDFQIWEQGEVARDAEIAALKAERDAAVRDLEDAVQVVYDVYGETDAAIITAHWRAIIRNVKSQSRGRDE